MSENIAEKIDRREEEKIDTLWETVESKEPITTAEIFDSKVIPKILEEKPLSYDSSFRKANPSLPLNCLLFSRMLVEICPGCSCSLDPELVKPYLERKMILPVLTHRLAHYKTNFSDLIVQYPYIGVYTSNFLRNVRFLISHQPQKSAPMCPHCFGESCERILKKLPRISKDKKTLDSIKGFLENVSFPALQPTYEQESQILQEIEEAVDQKKQNYCCL